MRYLIHCLKQNIVLQQLPNSNKDNAKRMFKWRFITFQVLLIFLWNEDPLMSGWKPLCWSLSKCFIDAGSHAITALPINTYMTAKRLCTAELEKPVKERERESILYRFTPLSFSLPDQALWVVGGEQAAEFWIRHLFKRNPGRSRCVSFCWGDL